MWAVQSLYSCVMVLLQDDSAALVPVTLVLPVILHNNMSYTTSTLTDQSSNTDVGSTKLSPLCNGFITGDTTEQIKNLPV